MIIAVFAFDVPFLFFNEGRRKIPKKFWQIIERLTMHIPLIIFGVYYYFVYQPEAILYFQLFTLDKFITALLLVCIPMFLFDPRITKKEDWPRGLFIVGGALIDVVGNILFFLWLADQRKFFDTHGFEYILGL